MAVNVTNIYPASQVFNISSTIEINATVTDADGIDTVLANITFPNGTVEQLTLLNNTPTVYNNTFTIPSIPGQFNVTFIANDTLGNINDTETTNFTSEIINPTSLLGLRTWYDASDNTTLYTDESCTSQVAADGDTIRCWQDKSSYSANATNVSGKGTPIFSTAVFNGLSVVNFSKSESDTLRHVIPSQYTSDFTIFLVIQSKDSNPDTFESFFSNGEPAADDHFQIDYTTTDDAFRYGASTKFNFETFSNDIKLYSVTHNGSYVTLYNEGGEVNNGTTTQGRVFEHYRINQNRNGDRHHDSYIGEIILYDRVLSLCEQEQVDIHLGDKYGRDFFGLSDNYGHGAPHNNDINGVGEFASSCAATKQFTSAESSIVTISNPSELDLNDSLTFAHNGGGFSLNLESVENYSNRINQSWRVDKDNEVGNVSIAFDLSSTSISLLSSEFALLIDTDTNFSDASIHTIGRAISGSTITFTQVNFTHGEYFTLAVTEKPPAIEFIDPTPANGHAQNQNNLIVNISSNASGDDHYTFVEFDSDLILWLRMDDVNASGDPTDLSSRSLNGSLENEASINSTGRFGDSAHFDGNNDYIDLPDIPPVFSSGFSACAWAYWSSFTQSWSRIFDFGQGQADDNILLAHQGTTTDLTFEVYNGGSGGNQVTATGVLQTGVWQHVCVIENASGYTELYVNGTHVVNGTANVPSTVTRNNAYIGRSNWGADGYLNGSIDEFILINRTLRAAEILSLYNASANQYLNNFSDLSEGNHTFMGYAVSQNGLKNQTQTRTVILDLTPPDVTALIPTAEFNTSTTIELAANITDDVAVGTVLANVTYPNATVEQVTLTNIAGEKYNISFTIPDLVGTYTLRIIANDTAGNVNNTQTTNFYAIEMPSIEFVDPTLENAQAYSRNNFFINISSNVSGGDHYTFVNSDNSLHLWMRMDDVNASGDPIDASGNGNNGSLQGNTQINDTGRFGDSAHFDGNGDFINLPASDSLIDNQGTWSMSVWFNAKSISGSSLGNRMLTLRNSSSLSAIALTLGNTNQLEFFYRNISGTGKTIGIRDISTDVWYHYVVTYNGSASKVYVNGELNTTISEEVVGTSNHTARIGANPQGSSEYFNGSIDELLIFNHEFTDQDVLSLYNASANQYASNTSTFSEGNHTFIGYTVAQNGLKNQTQTRTVTIDLTQPNVTDLNATPATTFNLTSMINISTNVTDSVGVGTVLANITLPNGSITQITLSFNAGDNYGGMFTAPGAIGNYTVRIIANDTAGNINGSETTTFEVQNSDPTASSIQINGGSDITLTSGQNTTIIGNATITDFNGYGDISNVTGYLFATTTGVGAVDNRSSHYTSICTNNSQGVGNSVNYNCEFNVSHYAIPTDAGSNSSQTDWTFLLTPLDTQGKGDNGTASLEVNTLLSFTIDPSIISFGDLGLGKNTTNSNKIINVTNQGNVGFDILLSGSNLSCSSGLVPVNFLEYKGNPFSYGIGVDLLESNVELDLDVKAGSEANATPLKSTYYGLGIPETSVGGNCSGNIILTGQSDPHGD